LSALLKPNALFINVGRGSLIKSEHILEALDAPDGLFGAGLDVTDPEPLPQGHPLWSHPKVIVTPHLSGDTEGEFDIATDIAIENAKRIRNGEQILNLVDFERGY
jgi:phosphoglycerate dehydrogenase-like enzyme